MESLTSEQITLILDILFSKIDVDKYMNSFKKADPDMEKTVQKICAISTSTQQKQESSKIPITASNKRLMEDWNSLWERWNDNLYELGDEHGKYAIQEEEWEPPYFDGSLLADDLEPIAQEMVSLIDEIYDLIDEPDLFYEVMDDMSSEILSYPEWMGVEEYEGCTLGEYSTLCVLKWLWLSSKDFSNPGKAFLIKVKEIDDIFKMVDIDDNECIEFFTKLPNEIRKDIYLRLNENSNKYNLDNIRSRWHKLHNIFEKTFDFTNYLETCKAHLADNWHYGLPLIRDTFDKGEYEISARYLQQTFAPYLHIRDKTKWYPETSLLISVQSAYNESENREEILELLKIWANVEEKLGNLQRRAAAKLQMVISQNSQNWDGIISTYREITGIEERKVVEPLFSQWKDIMARQSLTYGISSKVLGNTWIHWLIDAQLEKNGKSKGFNNQLENWLTQLKNDKESFNIQWKVLARLTRDLPISDKIKHQYPTFFEVVLPSSDRSSDLYQARKAGLDKMNASANASSIIEIWKKHLHLIIPNPSNVRKARYNDHARWMGALFELNRDQYNRVLTKWHDEHSRRKNLWRDMKARNLPIN